jgi:hypothetical protein
MRGIKGNAASVRDRVVSQTEPLKSSLHWISRCFHLTGRVPIPGPHARFRWDTKRCILRLNSCRLFL